MCFFTELIYLIIALPLIEHETLKRIVFQRHYGLDAAEFGRLAAEGDAWWKFFLYKYLYSLRYQSGADMTTFLDYRDLFENRLLQLIICISLGLHEEATWLQPLDPSMSHDAAMIKFYSDLFEAYLGALMRTDPLAGYLWIIAILDILLTDLQYRCRLQLEEWNMWDYTSTALRFKIRWSMDGPVLFIWSRIDASRAPVKQLLMEAPTCFAATAVGAPPLSRGHPRACELFPEHYPEENAV